MKIYFTASIVGKKHYLSNYLRIVDYLKNKGNQVISDHIINTTEDKIRMEDKNERVKFQRTLEDWITSSDVMIAETSFPSISVGYEISLAANRGKPILILYSEGDPPSLLAHHFDDKIICEKYSPDNLEDILEDFLNFAQGAADTRFTFFITSRLALYLENISKKKKIPKSVYLRYLIEKDIAKKK
ncbi:nucleoside 2-deoxyribosyltransferase [Patescibacteria group bacterium]|nr:nucleoside 2-deoxyribosyltransferase [Patescibacteria group bacterium]MCL5797676.1 nucleoside 2-deoxyribosyltransferase [Patescibacteria group bacterium]